MGGWWEGGGRGDSNAVPPPSEGAAWASGFSFCAKFWGAKRTALFVLAHTPCLGTLYVVMMALETGCESFKNLQ